MPSGLQRAASTASLLASRTFSSGTMAITPATPSVARISRKSKCISTSGTQIATPIAITIVKLRTAAWRLTSSRRSSGSISLA